MSSTSSINPSCDVKSWGSRLGRPCSPRTSLPNGRPPQVERYGEEVGALVAQQFDQHRREPVDGVRDLSGACFQCRRKCEVRAVRERVPVQQEDPFAAVVRGGGRHAADSSRHRRRPCPGRIRAEQIDSVPNEVDPNPIC